MPQQNVFSPQKLFSHLLLLFHHYLNSLPHPRLTTTLFNHTLHIHLPLHRSLDPRVFQWSTSQKNSHQIYSNVVSKFPVRVTHGHQCFLHLYSRLIPCILDWKLILYYFEARLIPFLINGFFFVQDNFDNQPTILLYQITILSIL